MLVFTATSSTLTIGSSLVGVVPMADNRSVDGSLILNRFAPPTFLPEPPDPSGVLLLVARLRCLELPMLVIDLLGLVHFVEALLGTHRLAARDTPHPLDVFQDARRSFRRRSSWCRYDLERGDDFSSSPYILTNGPPDVKTPEASMNTGGGGHHHQKQLIGA